MMAIFVGRRARVEPARETSWSGLQLAASNSHASNFRPRIARGPHRHLRYLGRIGDRIAGIDRSNRPRPAQSRALMRSADADRADEDRPQSSAGIDAAPTSGHRPETSGGHRRATSSAPVSTTARLGPHQGHRPQNTGSTSHAGAGRLFDAIGQPAARRSATTPKKTRIPRGMRSSSKSKSGWWQPGVFCPGIPAPKKK